MYVFNSNEGLGGTGALKFSSAMANSKKALTNKTEHVTQNNPTGPGPSGVRENIFHLFRSSASGKYNMATIRTCQCQDDKIFTCPHGSLKVLVVPWGALGPPPGELPVNWLVAPERKEPPAPNRAPAPWVPLFQQNINVSFRFRQISCLIRYI